RRVLFRSRLRAALDGERISPRRVTHANAHPACRRAMLRGEIGGRAPRLVVGDEVDPTLPPQLHVLAAMACNEAEAHPFEGRLEDVFFGRAEFEKFEPVETQWIIGLSGHGFQCNLCWARREATRSEERRVG